MNTNSNHFSVFTAPIIWISLVVLQPSLLIYWGFIAAPLWQRQRSLEGTQMNTGMFPLQQWIIIIIVGLNEEACRFWERAWNHLCMTTTLLVSVKNNTVFMHCSRAFLCQPSCVNWHMSRNSMALACLGRVGTNLHDLLLSVTMLQNIIHYMVD
jgi:hypothetical protein